MVTELFGYNPPMCLLPVEWFYSISVLWFPFLFYPFRSFPFHNSRWFDVSCIPVSLWWHSPKILIKHICPIGVHIFYNMHLLIMWYEITGSTHFYPMITKAKRLRVGSGIRLVSVLWWIKVLELPKSYFQRS